MTFSARLAQVFSLALLLSGVRSDDASAERKWQVGQAVDTTSGTILGHAAPVTTNVSEYLGIRFAKPPVGNLRFAKPERFWSDRVFNASAFVRTSQLILFSEA
jgi:hypothetical protein